MATPTKEAIIGTFINGRNAQDDFLQLANNHGGTVFAWIDYQGKLQGTFATSSVPAGSNTQIQFNNNGVFGADSSLTFNPAASANPNGIFHFGQAITPSLFSFTLQSEAQFVSTADTGGDATQTAVLQAYSQGNNCAAIGAVNESTSAGERFGVNSNVILNGVTGGVFLVGVFGNNYVYNSHVTGAGFESGGLFGGWFEPTLDQGSTAQAITGVMSDPSLGGTGSNTATTVVAFQAWPTLTAASTFTATATDVRGFDAAAIEASGGGTIAITNAVDFYAHAQSAGVNNYGLYIEDFGTGATSWAHYVVGGNNYFGGASSNTTTLKNTAAATNILNQNSPSLLFTGQAWSTNGGAHSETTTYAIQNLGGILQFNQTVGTSPSQFPIQFNTQVEFNNLVQLGVASVAFGTGNGNGAYVVSAAANASGATTTYTVSTIPTAGNPVTGQNITIAGFVAHAANNGYFVVAPGGDSTHIVVYNSSGVAETHAATATLDGNYDSSIGQYAAQLGQISAANFPIAGTSYIPNNVFNAYPNSPLFVMNVKGESQDAAYARILNDGTTGNHGLEIGGIIDSTGAAPVTFQLGHFNGVSSAVLNVPLTVKGTPPTGGAGQISFGGAVGFGNGSSGTAVTTTTKSTGSGPATPQTIVGYYEIDVAGTKAWVPYVQ